LAEVIARTTACAKPAVLHAMATGAAVMRVSDAEWRRLFPELTRADLPASTQEVPTMATRLDRDRRPATASSVWLGDPRPAAPEYGPDSPHPITTRDIHTVGRHIGWLYHRDYDSGYPGRYEVGMLGGRPWSFYDTEDDAVRGAEEYAAAVLRPGPQRLAQGLVDLHRLPTPIDRAVLASTPSLLRPWPTGREGRRQVARELRAAACGHLDPMSYHRRPDRRRRLPGRRRVSPEAGSTPEEPGERAEQAAVGDVISWPTWGGQRAVVRVDLVARAVDGSWHLTDEHGHTEFHDRLPARWRPASPQERACHDRGGAR
jgi:hypothetical protein